MVYRSDYANEIQWLDRVEATINSLRNPQDLKPDEYQQQLDILISEYSQLQERTQAIEQVNHHGGKFIREARVGLLNLNQYVCGKTLLLYLIFNGERLKAIFIVVFLNWKIPM